MDEERKSIYRDRDRLRHAERYRNDPEYRACIINYVTMRRQDPEYRAHRNALARAARARKKSNDAKEEEEERNEA